MTMEYDFQPIGSLVDEIKGTVAYLSKIFSPRLNLVYIVIIFGAILAVNFLLN
jgi:hypothetical protein